MQKQKHKHTLGSGPIEDKYRTKMRRLAEVIDRYINGHEKPKKNGFVLMMFPFEGFAGRCNYISNAQRKDIVTLLKEQASYFEGMPDVHADNPRRDQ